MAEPTKSAQTTGTQYSGGAQPGSSNPTSSQGVSATATRTAREQTTQPMSREQDWERSAKETVNQAARKGEEMYDKTRENLSDAYNRASRSVQETWDQAMDYGRNNPGTTTLIAFGAGLGLGLLIASNMNSRSRTERIVPPVMRALSDLAVEFFR